ncbi:L-amino acid oxidase [Diaporthe sp. PMI_573]|nr:L-amino acid oxidase [Diaporthaceae sp. PMI_573]
MLLRVLVVPICSFLLAPSTASPTRHTTRQESNAAPATGSLRADFFKEIIGASNYSNHSKVKTPDDVPLKVGIIGAGAAGLYAAMLLDSLGIDYDIHEGSDRIGGRIFTYRFDQEAWDNSTPDEPGYYDYYDVGAMRFPPMTPGYMERILGSQNWSLIPYINSHPNVAKKDQVVQIPYIFSTNSTFRLFNNVLAFNNDSTSPDQFHVDLLRDNNSDPFNALGASLVYSDSIANFMQVLNDTDGDLSTQGWNHLMDYDSLSIRAYLFTKGFTMDEIDWLETMNDATGHYDMYSVPQAVLEEWIFQSTSIDHWTCIRGGMDMITKGMTLVIKSKPQMHNKVTDIRAGDKSTLRVIVNHTVEYNYSHVVSTVPLGPLQAINLTELELGYFQNNAIRTLNYDPSTKVGIKFKTRWWENLPSGAFQGGQSFTDLPIRRAVYPSYGLNVTGAPGTMIGSYVWGQDASRLGAYLNAHNNSTQAPYQPGGFEELTEITLSDLAALNNVSYGFVREQFVGIHAYDWYQSEASYHYKSDAKKQFSNGAFAMFGPGEFSTVMPYLMTPAWNGHMHFGGEALSSGHAWIIGAVNSAWRTVMEILDTEGLEDKADELNSMWGGPIDDVDMGWYDFNTMGWTDYGVQLDIVQ